MPQGEFRITGPGEYRTRDGRRAFVRGSSAEGWHFWIEGDEQSSPDDPWFCKPNGRGWFDENPRDLIAYIGPLPDARPAPEAVDWARARVKAAMRFHALKLAACYGDDALTSGAHVVAGDLEISFEQCLAREAVSHADALVAELRRTEGQS